MGNRTPSRVGEGPPVKPSPTRYRKIVDDMRRYSAVIASTVRRGKDDFDTDIRNRATIEHYLELLGEATHKLGKSFQNENPGIPWKRLGGFRFDSAHPYDEEAAPVNYGLLWRFASDELPKIDSRLRGLRYPKDKGHD